MSRHVPAETRAFRSIEQAPAFRVIWHHDSADRTTMSKILACVLSVVLLATACTGSTSQSSPTTSPTTTAVITTDPLPLVDEPPPAPTGLFVVSTSDARIELAWNPSRSSSVTGYEIMRIGSGVTEHFTTPAPTFVDDNLEDGSVYTYTVAAVSDAGTSPRSDSVTARVGIDSSPPTVPGRPHPIESDEATMALTWRSSRDIAGIAKYVVTRTIDGVATEFDVEIEEFIDEDVAAGIIATYSVRAVDSNGNTSEEGRSVTVLTGSTSDDIVMVVSAVADPAADPNTDRLRQALLDAGFIVSWFEDGLFDANLTDPGDVVLLLGDVEAEGFDWNIFTTDATVIGLKSMFVQAGGITDNPPKLDRLAQLTYMPPGDVAREVSLTTTGRPKPVVYIPVDEQLPDLQVWARPVWSNDIAVAGLVSAGGELANEKPSPGCRAFFPGNSDSLAEQSDRGWELLIEFVSDISDAC